MKKLILTLLTAVCIAGCFAQGGYLEFKITGEKDGITGTMKLYTQDGSSRSEMQMNMGQIPGGMNITSLTLKDNPDKIYMLNDNSKTYTELDKTKGGKTKAETEYEITVIGKENVNNYNATHVKIKEKTTGHEMEMWLSTEIPNYEKYKNISSKYTDDYMFRAMRSKGVDGFPVRITTAEHEHSMQLDLIKAEAKTNPASLFSLDGYSKSASNAMPGSSQMQEMMKNMQNMTPEQRQEMIEKMKQQYGGTGTPKK